MDKYESIRALPFPALASALGIDMARFKRRQTDWQGYCPIHQSKTNNNCFAYHDSGKFHCFSCGAKGAGAIDLTKLVKNIGFQAAVELLQPLVGQAVQIPAPAAIASPEANAGALRPLEKDTWKKFQVPCPWLEQRIPDAAIREKYGCFCYHNPARKSAYSGRVMLPVKDSAGALFGYLGRSIVPETEPKYLFPKNLPKSRFLFGSAEILAGTFGPAPLRVVYLVESPFCVMKFAMYGLPALALFGWSVSEEQATLLATLARGVCYLPDRNKYQEAANNASILLSRLWCKMPMLPESIQDPEYLTKEQVLAL